MLLSSKVHTTPRHFQPHPTYAWLMSTDEEKDPPVPADVEGKIPKKVHDTQSTEAQEGSVEEPREN